MAEKLPDWFKVAIAKEQRDQLPDWFIAAIGAEQETDLAGVRSPVGVRDEGEDTDFKIDFTTAPRGIRNNNPGNVENTQPWQGQAKDSEKHPSQAKENRFAVFSSPEWGIRAMGKVMQTYRTKHGITTVQGIINRWAPPSENDTNSYVASVASEIGVGPNDRIDVTDPKVLQPLLTAIIRHENGEQPYSSSQISAGIDLVFNNGES